MTQEHRDLDELDAIGDEKRCGGISQIMEAHARQISGFEKGGGVVIMEKRMKWAQKAIRHGTVVAERPVRLGEAGDRDYASFVSENHADSAESIRSELEATGVAADELLDQLRDAKSLDQVKSIGEQLCKVYRYARPLTAQAA